MDTADFKHFGRMNDPDASAFFRGICGDEMEFYLLIKNDAVEKIRFFTDGCEHTGLCGETAARLAEGMRIDEVMSISPGAIIKDAGGLPEDHLHCAILASMTLYRALADYLYKKQW
jgi:nitrogen fixation NifU-like protein